MRLELPVDRILPELLQKLQGYPAAVLTAEPGAGKTTRVPPFLAQELAQAGEQIWVLEPRRLAAYVSANRVAEEHGSPIGAFAGYHFRFEHQEGPDCRVLFLTEGMFLRRLQSNAALEGVAAVLLDEFHERSLDSDLSLALLQRLRRRRPELRLLVMSATLDSQALSQFLGAAPVVNCPGRNFPIEQRYLEKDRSDPTEPLERRLIRGLKGLEREAGHWLVFLPGMAEIRRAETRLKGDPHFDGREIHVLHGSLSPEEQRSVLRPGTREKIILASAIAETSLTVPGVRVVVDAGLSRREVFNPYSGLASLQTFPANQSSMQQRAGRAGREAAGMCLRLCSAAEYQARPQFEAPEITRADLTSASLQAHAAGFKDFLELEWLDAPPPAQLLAAQELLGDFGALSAEGALTALGQRLARAPLDPRLAILALECGVQNDAEEGALLGALYLLAEGRPRHLDFMKALQAVEFQGAAARWHKQVKAWLREELPRRSAGAPFEERLGRAALLAFPKQVALSKKGSDKRGETRFQLAAGGEAYARDESMRLLPGYYLLLELLDQKNVQGQGGLPRVFSLLPLSVEELLEGQRRMLQEDLQLSFEPQRQRIQARSSLRYGSLVLEENERLPEGRRTEASSLLRQEARKAGLSVFCAEGQPQRYLERRSFALSQAALELPGEAALWEILDKGIDDGALSFQELRALDPLGQILSGLGEALKNRLERLAPRSVKLGKGRELQVHYEEGKTPWAASRLQDFFGMRESPRIGEAGKPLTLHLLGPNQRPLQISADLAGFWQRDYPKLRQELSRRYPRHAWPEDPLHV